MEFSPPTSPRAKLDLSLYDRQARTLGMDAMKSLTAAKVLIYGLTGVGVEIAKNVILSGVKAVFLMDDAPATTFDQGSQFYLSDSDIGKPRASGCVRQLASLNQYVRVKSLTGELTEDIIKSLTCLVLAYIPSLEFAIKINFLCRKHNVKFICAENCGLFTFSFNDFGDTHGVNDADGEPPATFPISSISNDKLGTVLTVEGARHNLYTGDKVTFKEVQGMDINGKEFTVNCPGPYAFELGDMTGEKEYIDGGFATQIKQSATFNFKPLQQQVSHPTFFQWDFSRPQLAAVLHACFFGLYEWRGQQKSAFPTGPDAMDYKEQEVLMGYISKYFNMLGPDHRPGWFSNSEKMAIWQKGALKEQGEFYDIAKIFCRMVQATLSPLAAAIGGWVGQEVIKAASHKYGPTIQCFYFAADKCLPPDAPLKSEIYKAQGNRYDSSNVIFGNPMTTKIRQQRLFLIGAGAIGCEILKNFALMGVASKDQGILHCTDMDAIEKSNLNRQFLFRPNDVNHNKAERGTLAARRINPDLKFKSYTQPVGHNTEDLFSDEFFSQLDGCCNALDNLAARKYVDSRCLYYGLPLLESGTRGTKGNTVAIIPHVSQSYTEGTKMDPPEKGTRSCTVKLFPFAPDHCVSWAKAHFSDIFDDQPKLVNQYLDNPEGFSDLVCQNTASANSTLNSVEAFLSNPSSSWKDCALWAREQFEQLFNSDIRDLTHNLPRDHVKSSGQRLWTSPKRFPEALEFDKDNPHHSGFIIAMANLRAAQWNLNPGTNAEALQYAESVKVEPWKPTEKTYDTEEGGDSSSASEDCSPEGVKARIAKFPKWKGTSRLFVNEFEKDSDTNHHMDMITSAANCRCLNYTIETVTSYQAKGIAGNIIPAIATTTAFVAGVICLELYKYLAGRKDIESYINAYTNLAIPMIQMTEPPAPALRKAPWKVKKNPDDPEPTISEWDTIDITEAKTLKEVLEHLKTEYKLSGIIMNADVGNGVMLHMDWMPKADRMNMTLDQIYQIITKKPLDPNYKYLPISVAADCNGVNEIELPVVRYLIPKASSSTPSATSTSA